MTAETYKQKLKTADVHRSSMAYKLCTDVLNGRVFIRPCYRQGFSIRDYSLQTIGLLKFIGVEFHIGNDGERLGSVNQYIRITDKELLEELKEEVRAISTEIHDIRMQRTELYELFAVIKPRKDEGWIEIKERVKNALTNPIVYKDNSDVLQIVVNHIYKLKHNGNQ